MYWIIPSALIVAVGSFWGYDSYLSSNFCPPKSAAEFGDAWGAYGALFSGLAFFALLFTIQLQVKELRLTKIELEKSAKAQKDTSEALQDQLKLAMEANKVGILKTQLDSELTQNNGGTMSSSAIMISGMIEHSALNFIRRTEYQEFCRPKLYISSSQTIEEADNTVSIIIQLTFQTRARMSKHINLANAAGEFQLPNLSKFISESCSFLSVGVMEPTVLILRQVKGGEITILLEDILARHQWHFKIKISKDPNKLYEISTDLSISKLNPPNYSVIEE